MIKYNCDNFYYYVSATDLQPIKSDISALALREATNEASAAFNLPNQFIDTFTDDTNLGTQTDGDRISGYWATVYSSVAAFTNDANTKLLLQSTFDDAEQNFCKHKFICTHQAQKIKPIHFL